MKIAVIGTGRMGNALTRSLLTAGKEVWIAGRTLQKAERLCKELNHSSLRAVAVAEAIEQADIILPALWFEDEKVFAKKYKDALKGKIYLNISVPFDDSFENLMLPYGISAAEIIQQLLPETKVVAGFKNTFWKVLENPADESGLTSDVFITSDHKESKQQVLLFLQPLPFRFIDGGRLCENRTIERMTLFSRKIAKREGFYPRVSFRIWGF